MNPEFLVALLEGFEGTLDVLLKRLADGELRCEITALQRHIALKRQRITEMHAET